MRRTTLVAVLFALGGATLVVGSASLDLLRLGSPGFGATQAAGLTLGLSLLVASSGLAARSGPPGAADLPWILGAAALGTAGMAFLFAPAPERARDPAVEFSLVERMVEAERPARTPRRRTARCRPTSELVPSVAVEPVLSGLRKPVHVTISGDGSRRLFVVEKGGTIRVANGRDLASRPFLDIRDRVMSDDDDPDMSWERGLLSVAFPPDFARTGAFYVQYTAEPDGTITVSRFRVAERGGPADPASEEVLLSVSTDGPHHNGGQLQFGPDGYLYAGFGDGGGARWPSGDPEVYGDGAVEFRDVDVDPVIPPGSGFTERDVLRDDPWNQARDLGSLMGKLVRLDVSADEAYAIPKENPYFGRDGETSRAEIYASGFRNPWRFSFDSCDGALFVADVGDRLYEEVNLVVAGGDYGWPVMEAARCAISPWLPQHCDTSGLTFPIADYGHIAQDPEGGNAVVGGYVYRGRRIPGLVGRYVFADFMSARVWALSPDGHAPTGWRRDELLTLPFLPTSFGLDADGELLVVGYGGTIHRFVPR